MNSGAYYDPTTDTIVGCEPGSYAWEHEQRHREQYLGGLAGKLDAMHVTLYYAAFPVSIIGAFINGLDGAIYGIGMVMLPHILGLMYLEADAYLVGWLRWRKRPRG